MDRSEETFITVNTLVLDEEDEKRRSKFMDDLGRYYANLNLTPEEDAIFFAEDDEWMLADVELEGE